MEGQTLAGYDLREKLGEGGMGTVYRAEDRRIGRPVAIKMIRPDRLANDRTRERFLREARSIGALNHPNIATLYDVELESEAPYIVMEYLSGGSLLRRIQQGPMTLGQIMRSALAICQGLEHAHTHSVVHRDLKPANILYSADGIPKIIDFGLASMPDEESITQPGLAMGTAEYMSPEQACGHHVDRRSDIFSLGVILYQMASGHHPFQSDSIPVTLHRIMYDPPAPLAELRPDLPAGFTRLVGAMLEKKPENRPQNLREVIAMLEALDQSVSGVARAATETIAIHPLVMRTRRYRRPALAVLVAAVLLSAGWAVRARWYSNRLPATRELVVLPFENLSHDPLEQAFCDGLVELVTSSLTQMEKYHSTLWVIPSTDVRRLQLTSVIEARKAFHVNLAVTGSLQTDGNQVLVIVNLVDAATMRQIGSRMIPVSHADRSLLTGRLTAAMMELLDLSIGRDALRGSQSTVVSAADLYVQARGLLQHTETAGNLDRAIQLLEQSVGLDPKFALAQASLADAYLRRYSQTKEKEWLAKADMVARRALDLDGTQSTVHLTMGRLYRATGQSELAIAEFQKAISLDPLSVPAYTNLALAYTDMRRPADAENTYLQAIRIRPSYWPAYSNLGVFYYQRGEYAKALEPTSLVVKLAPNYSDGHTSLGSLYYHLDRVDDALAEFTTALELHPTAFAFSNRGGIYFARRQYEKAREDYRHALGLQGNDPMIWGNLADTEAQIPGAEADARKSYERAIELSRESLSVNPKDADVLGRMAYYLSRTANCAEAHRRIEEARRLAPDRVALIFKSAKVAEACHEPQSALTYLESAIRKGYSRREIEQDPDFSRLRQSPAYAAIMSRTAETKR